MKLPKDSKELLAALFAVTVAAVVLKAIELLLGSEPREKEIVPVTLFTGWLLATGCGEALWLAWGTSNLFWRLVVVGVGVLLLCVLLGGVDWLFLIVFSTILVSASVLALPRIFGIRRCRLNADGVPQAIATSRQFSLRDVFLWTTCVALLLGIASWTGFFNYLTADYEWVLRFSIFLVVCGWAAMWAILAHRDRIVVRLLLAALPTAAACFALSDEWMSSDFAMTISAALNAYLIVCGGLYILRRKGIRMVRGRSIHEPKSNVESSAPADTSPFDADDGDGRE
jgi:hypothetical protein